MYDIFNIHNRLCIFTFLYIQPDFNSIYSTTKIPLTP